jgi:integrase
MGIFKRGDVWYYEVRVAGRKVRHAVSTKKRDAEQAMAKAREAAMLGRFPELRRIKPVLFKDHAAEVLTQHYGAKRSQDWAKLVIDTHLVPFFGNLYLGQIDPKLIGEYVTKRLSGALNNKAGRRPGHATLNNERAILSKVMSLAVKWERIASNPVTRVEKLEAPKGRLRFLTHEEADKLILAAPKHLKAVLVVALETGGRLSEVLGLKWDDIDFDRGLLFFRQTNTKNAKQREIPMTPLLTSTLRSLPRSISSSFIFVRFGKPMRDIRTGFDAARDRADLGPDVVFHTLRHTFAAWYISTPGSDLHLLQALLGHQDLKTTMIYAHLSPTYRRSAVALMGRHGEGKSVAPPKRPQSEGEPGNAVGGSKR